MVCSQAARLQFAGTRIPRLPVQRQGLNHSSLFEWNMVNPTFRLLRQATPQGALREWRAEEHWRKPKPSCNRTDRGCGFNPAAQAGRLPAWSIVTRELVEPSTRGKANERGFIHVCVLRQGGALGSGGLAQVSTPSQEAASAYRKGNTGKPLGQGENLATAADLLVFRQSLGRETGDGKSRQANAGSGQRKLELRQTNSRPSGRCNVVDTGRCPCAASSSRKPMENQDRWASPR